MGVLLGIVALLIVALVLVALLREPAGRGRFLKRVGFWVTALFTAFIGLFIVGDTLTDPGGWEGVGLVALWAIPFAGLATLAWYRPDVAARVFAVLVLAVVGLSVWFAINPGGWRSFENHNGPVLTVITFVLAAALAVFGLKRTALAGMMLLVVGIVPIALSRLGHGGGFGSLAVASIAPVLTGTLYLASAATSRESPPAAGATPQDQPMAG